MKYGEDERQAMSEIHNGDTAEYVGEHEPLRGKRCTVDSWSPKRKRVRVIVEVGGRAALRSVKPANLKRLGGGYWRTVMSAER